MAHLRRASLSISMFSWRNKKNIKRCGYSSKVPHQEIRKIFCGYAFLSRAITVLSNYRSTWCYRIHRLQSKVLMSVQDWAFSILRLVCWIRPKYMYRCHFEGWAQDWCKSDGCFSPNLISSPWRRYEYYNISFCKQWKFRCHCSYEQWHLNLHCLQRGPSCP